MRTIIQHAPRVIAFIVAGGASFWGLIGLLPSIVVIFSPSMWKDGWIGEVMLICGYSAIVGLFWRGVTRSPSKLLSVFIWLWSLIANIWAMFAMQSFYPTHWDPWDIWLAVCWLDIAVFLSLLGFVFDLITNKMPNT
jgi:hypothetical protein